MMASDCAWCEEPIAADERSVKGMNFVMHAECMVRSVVGSLAHLKGTCSCYVPGSTDNDPPELSKRKAAKIVMIEAAICQRPGCAP